MSDSLLLAAVTVTAFASTNLDNLILLTALLAAGRRRGIVLAGHGIVTVLVIGLALLGASLGRVIPVEYVGLLGLIPLGMGVVGLLRPAGQETGTVRQAPAGIGASVAVLLPMSGDSFAVFLPLLAESPAGRGALIVGTFLVTAALWVIIAGMLASRRAIEATLTRYAHRVMPLLQIAVGVYVLADTPTDTLIPRLLY